MAQPGSCRAAESLWFRNRTDRDLPVGLGELVEWTLSVQGWCKGHPTIPNSSSEVCSCLPEHCTLGYCPSERATLHITS